MKLESDSVTTHRKRKTKAPCDVCRLRPDLCLCHLIPDLNLKTRVCLVVHAKELKRTTNTGQLALRALKNSEMRIRGLDRSGLDLSDLLDPHYQSVLFYPSEDAVELTANFLQADPRPLQLIVPDGNWRQASKVHHRHPELKHLPRVMIKDPNPFQYHLRAETTPEGMATMLAIACALGVTEGAAAKDALMQLYQAKLERTLQARGVKTWANLALPG